ncbi:PREDICTED: protein FAR1-RELATED SEQUENCE 5-like [Ipomoea nil]|uniref:protein FAR1-RELATED SEQUENCE 5-like n=1 Tax=Ipomoea nil TaxID=35883 RepID=UPI000901A663|nr:PREDICTED: protein FAR1-RELATED SEQUENCE 5-like [Ipomoea nil]
MRGNRKLSVAQQAFLANCIKANIGSSTGFRLCKEVAGSYENVGATDMEFHNFKRDLQSYVDVVDGEMIIERFKTKREVCDRFFFDYHLDEENRLARLFWADPIGRGSFSCYGDVISFDATYSTNRYSLVFVLFTGVDNHKRCITFAAGLITKEDVESYSWLLERFIGAMGKPPLCAVTDQDPAMKIAMDQVIPECRHRYCMWHIMTKVSEKVGPELAKNEVFRKSLNDIVWNERISSSDFEVQWQLLMEECNLSEHRWFRKLFAEREHWIPAFFSDLPMSGLRHKQAKLDAQCEGYLPEFKTPLALERDIAKLFTLAIFYDMQPEIDAACFYCEVVDIRKDGTDIYYDITGDSTTTYTVHYKPDGCIAFCSCKMFQRMGLICRHMFLVFKGAHLEQLPSQYIMDRWRKHLSCGACRGRHPNEHVPQTRATEVWSEINTCVGLVGESTARQARMVQVLKELSKEFACDGTNTGTAKGNSAAIAALCGVQPPQSITIKPPAQAKNKGSGKRLKSNREIAIENSAKVGRKCGLCGEYACHNARSCPSRCNMV